MSYQLYRKRLFLLIIRFTNYSSFSDCTVKEDFYGHTFNLTNLHGKIDKKVKDTGIEINICGAGLLNSQCGTDAAICDGDKLVAKTSKETLSFSSGRLELSYEGKLESIYRRKFSLCSSTLFDFIRFIQLRRLKSRPALQRAFVLQHF